MAKIYQNVEGQIIVDDLPITLLFLQIDELLPEKYAGEPRLETSGMAFYFAKMASDAFKEPLSVQSFSRRETGLKGFREAVLAFNTPAGIPF